MASPRRALHRVWNTRDLVLEILEWCIFFGTVDTNVCDVLDTLKGVCRTWSKWIDALPDLRLCRWLFPLLNDQLLQPVGKTGLPFLTGDTPLLDVIRHVASHKDTWSLAVSLGRPSVSMELYPNTDNISDAVGPLKAEMKTYHYPMSEEFLKNLEHVINTAFHLAPPRGPSNMDKHSPTVSLSTHVSKDLNDANEWSGNRRIVDMRIQIDRVCHRFRIHSFGVYMVDRIAALTYSTLPKDCVPFRLPSKV
jgi:hypothetical protein